MKKVEMQLLNCLEKVFPTKRPDNAFGLTAISGLRGEEISLQAAYMWEVNPRTEGSCNAELHVISSLGDAVRCRKVGYVPSLTPNVGGYDEDVVLTAEPGLFPDILLDMKASRIKLVPMQWRSVWIDVALDADTPAGEYVLTVQIAQGDEVLAAETVVVTVIDACLPEQTLIHTEWFHSDCIADYYEIPVFSEAHWAAIGNFIELAVKRGINMILTPVFTPPLDTAVGGERTTVQLVDVTMLGDSYVFGFEKFDRWVKLCLEKGVQYIEIAHLYTQWGACCAPKVMASVDGTEKRLFGWDTEATSPAYKAFLQAFLPALTARLHLLGVAGKTFFHISDEPDWEHDRKSYEAAVAQVRPYLEGFEIIDALSNIAFYESGLVKRPIPANNHIEPFLDAKVERLWTYYCVGQMHDVSNRFMALPSAQNRILGVQLYKFDMEGFLHWGYNFYNSSRALDYINPFMVTDADCSFSSGDAFLVYPGRGLKPVESIRMMVLFHALQDLRALRLLEMMEGRAFVLALIAEEAGQDITFAKYPRDAAFLMRLRERVNAGIAARSGA